MAAKEQVEKERLRKIKELDKKRKGDLFVLLGGPGKPSFLTEKPWVTSSLQASTNLSDRPST